MRSIILISVLLSVGLPIFPAQAAERLEFWDEALRLFGTAPAGGDVTENRALKGNRIAYLQGGNIYPDQDAVKYFSLDYTEKRSGDFSVRFDNADAHEVALVGFMPGPCEKGWTLSKNGSLHLSLKAVGVKNKDEWSLTLLDRNGGKATGRLTGFAPDGQWHELNLPLASLNSSGSFDFSQSVACQLEPKLSLDGKVWFDEIYFTKENTGEEIGVTDKSIEQRRGEAKASRLQRVKEAFEDIARHTPATLKLNDRHVYFRDLLNIPFAKLWLGQDIEKTNAELLAIFTSTDLKVRGEYLLDEHWCLATTPMLIQMYYTFGSRAGRMPGRLEEKTEKALLELLWERTKIKNDIVIARQSTWWMAGSENHDINAKVSNLLSSQIFMNEPAYADRVYPDPGWGSGYGYGKHSGVYEGRASLKDGKEYLAKDHYQAWVDFWMEWFMERAKKGPFIEVNSPGYMLYSLGYLQSLYDLCQDQPLRDQAGRFFHMVWADWAQDQIAGIRGGARTRGLRGRSGYDSMTQFAKFLLGGPGDACHGFYHILLSDYRLPKIIWELALDRESLGDFAYISRRPGEEENVWPRPLGNERTLLCDTESRFVRYSWVTPDYVLGTQMDHPAAVHSHLSCVSRWEGIVFSGADKMPVDRARIYPCTLATSKPKIQKDSGLVEYMANNRFYRSVQHRNVLITQQSRNYFRVNPEWFPATEFTQPMGVHFGKYLDRIEEKEGWVFAQKGNAYVAVRVLIGAMPAEYKRLWDAGQRAGLPERDRQLQLRTDCYTWNDDRTIIKLKYAFSPIIIEAGRRADFATLEDFQKAILSNPLQLLSTVVPDYEVVVYTGSGPGAKEIIFNAATTEMPTVGDEYINYAPAKLYDSPYMQSDYNSGIVTVEKGDQKLILDFKNAQTKEKISKLKL